MSSQEPRLDIDEILERASSLTPTARERFLSEACAEDPGMLDELRSLLAVLEESRGFLEGEGTVSPTQNIGPYALGRIIGAGGMGTVYLGERADGEFQRKVAVKLIQPGLRTPEIIRRFDREKRVLARLDHPNIARLLDGGATPDGRPYLIMEYVEGEPIDRYCDTRRLGIRDRLLLMREVGEAVDYAHRQQVVHRDIKPANVLVDRDGNVKLLDFGIAKVLTSTDPVDQTHTGLQRLTPRYASPEQVLHQEITPASDVYSAGVLLYELLTGGVPYETESAAIELSDAVVRQDPIRPSVRASRAAVHVVLARGETTAASLAASIRGDLEHILLQTLAKDPDARYPSMAAFSRDLERYLGDEKVEARPESFRAKARRVLRKHPLSLYLSAERAKRESEDQRQIAETIAGLLQDVLASIDPKLAQGRDIELLRSVLDVTAKRVRRELEPNTLLCAKLQTTIGRAYHAIGAYDVSEAHLREALLARLRVGASAGELAESHLYLGGILKELSRYRESLELLREGLEFGSRATPPDRALEARLRLQIGKLHEILGDDDLAFVELGRAVELGTEVLGRESLEVIHSIGALASFLTTRDRLEEAETLVHESVDLARLSGDGPTLAWALCTQGFYLHWTRNEAGAEPVYREALRLREQIYGRSHPFVASTQVDLAVVLEGLEKFEEAEMLYLGALEIDRRCSGARSLDVGTKLNNIGGLLRKVGRLEEAQRYLEEALSIYVEKLGEAHLWVVIARTNLGAVLVGRRDFGRAEGVLRAAQDQIGDRWAEGFWRVALIRSFRGAALVGEGRTEEGRLLLREAAEAMESDLGIDDPRTKEARRRWESYSRFGAP